MVPKQEQEVMKMQSDMEKAVSSIDDKYAKLSQDFISLTSTEKAVFLNALKEKGISYEQASANEIAFDNRPTWKKRRPTKAIWRNGTPTLPRERHPGSSG